MGTIRSVHGYCISDFTRHPLSTVALEALWTHGRNPFLLSFFFANRIRKSYLAVAYVTLVAVRRDLQTFILAVGHVRSATV